MYKTAPPGSKSSLNSPESSPISQNPNIPSSREHHFKEEWVSKSFPCLGDTLLDTRAMSPINLQVIPNPATEVTFKEQVVSGFPSSQGTKKAVNPIIKMPMSSFDHVLSIKHVHD